jgi:hypothetical protein
LFVVGCWYLRIELSSIGIIITTLNICFVLHFKPYLEPRLYKTEIFNEIISLIFFILL